MYHLNFLNPIIISSRKALCLIEKFVGGRRTHNETMDCHPNYVFDWIFFPAQEQEKESAHCMGIKEKDLEIHIGFNCYFIHIVVECVAGASN